MKRILILTALLATLLAPALAMGSAGADDIFNNPASCGGAAKNTDVCKSIGAQQNDGSNPVIKVLAAAIDVISFITGALAVIFIIISALRFITAAGSSEGVASARTSLIYALVGIAVTALAQSLVLFVLDKVQ
jgi:hypothetical protein